MCDSRDLAAVECFCGRPIHHPTDNSYDQSEWVHDDGSQFCYTVNGPTTVVAEPFS